MRHLAKIDYKTAHAIGWDAGNRNMRRNGRKAWNEDDWNAAAAEFDRVFPEPTQTQRDCGTFKSDQGTILGYQAIADVVLAYRPKAKQPKPRKRKKAKRV